MIRRPNSPLKLSNTGTKACYVGTETIFQPSEIYRMRDRRYGKYE